MNYTYILRCGDGSLYTGWTNHLNKRVADHNAGRGAKYTKAHRPVELAYYEIFETKEEAMKRECAIKKLSRPQKERLIESDANLLYTIGAPSEQHEAPTTESAQK